MIGQISACLELAEQIERGEYDPPAIYLAVGSSCTISGLIIGVALARRLNMKAFRSPRFRIHGIPIHHALGMTLFVFFFLKTAPKPSHNSNSPTIGKLSQIKSLWMATSYHSSYDHLNL